MNDDEYDGRADAARADYHRSLEVDDLLARLEAEIRPLIEKDTYDGGYNCCGCSSYDDILDHAIRIVREELS